MDFHESIETRSKQNSYTGYDYCNRQGATKVGVLKAEQIPYFKSYKNEVRK